MMKLQDTNPLLFDFFAGYFPDADLDGLTDKEVVFLFTDNNPHEVILKTEEALDTLKSNDVYLLNTIAKEANQYFETPEEIWEWIQMIKTALNSVSSKM